MKITGLFKEYIWLIETIYRYGKITLAELDAIFAHLYGLTTDELRYILDPKDVCGPGCINETFRVLKDNEIRQYMANTSPSA
jgi:hypothetical protein